MPLPRTSFLDTSLQLPGVQLPVRTVVFELDGARVLLSPGSRLTETQLREAGAVTDIIAPSVLHTGGMKAAAKVHPSARLWGPPGAREKLPELAWHGTLGADPWPYERELQPLPIAGMPELNEFVFLHAASKALFVTDLAFNIVAPKGPLAWLIYRMFGTWRRFAVSKLFLRYVRDRDAFRASVAKIAALDFQHLVPSHGEAVLDTGKDGLLAAFRERGLLG